MPRRKKSRKLAVLIIASVILGLFLILGAIFNDYGNTVLIPDGQNEKANLLTAVRGQLTSPFVINTSEPFDLWLGGMGTSYTYSELVNGIDLTRFVHIEVGNQTVQFPVQINLTNNQLCVSATIKNANNETLVNVIDNQWHAVEPNSMLIWDRNFNSYAFELIDPNGIPALQILLGSQNTINIGFSLFSQGIPDYFGITTGTFLGGVTSADIQQIRNSTLFKYPSAQYPCEMLNSTGYPQDKSVSNIDAKIQLGHSLSITGIVLMAIAGVGFPFIIAEYVLMWRKKREENQGITVNVYVQPE
ncbi:MAG: hypothetical protein ABSG57_09715 [Candidatus Bathyarchaeia archaeon]